MTIIFPKQLFFVLIITGLILTNNACISSKKWFGDKHLLDKQTIIGYEKVSYDKLYYLMRQKPNRKVGPFMPYLWAYYWGEKIYKPEKIQIKRDKVADKFNKKITEATQEKVSQNKIDRLIRRKEKKLSKYDDALKDGNWLMRTVGEKPVFYDSTEAQLTKEEMEKYMRVTGFFQGKAEVTTKPFLKNRIRVTYKITENQPTFFGDVQVLSNNQRIDSIIQTAQKNSLIKKGSNYNEEHIGKERDRIVTLLKNNGYLFFSNQYIVFEVDTLHFQKDSLQLKQDSLAKTSDSLSIQDTLVTSPKEPPIREAKITMVINDPAKGEHTAYRINQVFFHDVNIHLKKQEKDTLTSETTEIKYIYEGRRLTHNAGILDRRIRNRPQQYYSELNRLETQRSLGLLNMFKFVNINTDTLNNNMNVNIYTTPLERYQLTNEIGFNVIQGLPGPFVNLTLKNRNTFGGAEIFENSLRYSIDGQASFANQKQYTNIVVGVNSSLTFAKMLFPYKLIPKNWRTNLDYLNPTTALSLGYNFVRRPEYTRTNLVASIGYKGILRNSTYNLTLSELSVVNTADISQEFDDILKTLEAQGNPIRNSFGQALVSSMYFVYTFNNNNGNETKKSHFIRVLFESGGTTLNLLKESSLAENQIFGLRTFQYWKINPTFNYYLPLRKTSSMAFRINAGVAKPYGSSVTLPYEKFYFAGGSNSLRAWPPRRLGPGRVQPVKNENGTFDYKFEQPGELILEGNVEYRFPIFGFIKGALFVDAGNIWTLQEDDTRQGAVFHFDTFYQEIALGTGFGIRFNLPFLLFRIDFGIKAYDPARISEEPWVIKKFNVLKPFKDDLMLINIGIGYPF